MIRRRGVTVLGLALLAAPAAAQEATTGAPAARPRPGRQSQAARPLPLPPPPPPPPDPDDASEPAPVPNRDLEAPRGQGQAQGPQLNPALIDPDDPQAATAHDPSSLRAREERLLRNPAPGARLRVPFSY